MTGYCERCGEQVCVCVDGTLEIAKKCGAIQFSSPYNYLIKDKAIAMQPEELQAFREECEKLALAEAQHRIKELSDALRTVASAHRRLLGILDEHEVRDLDNDCIELAIANKALASTQGDSK